MRTLQPPDQPAGPRTAPRHGGVGHAANDAGPATGRRPLDDRGGAPRQVLLCLLSGAALAAAVTLALPGNFAWFLAAIPHEIGHATIGALMGLPSAPAISLAGHAWTGHGEFRAWLVLLCAIACGAFAIALRARPVPCGILGTAAVLVPVCAFTRTGEVLTIAGGHLGELLFATWCFALVVTGGRTGGRSERTAGAMAGCLLQFHNARLCWGLMTSAAARQHYSESGSLGLENDYLRLAQHVFHCRLETVAALMFVLALLPLPAGLWAGQRFARAADR